MEGSRLAPPSPAHPSPSSFPWFTVLTRVTLLVLLFVGVWTFRHSLFQLFRQAQSRLAVTSPTPVPPWSVYSDGNISFMYPGLWHRNPKTPTGCGYIQSLTDPSEQYEISVTARCNYNTATGKPFASLEDYLHESASKVTYVTIDSANVAKITSYLTSSQPATEVVFISPAGSIYSISLGSFTFTAHPSPLPDSLLPVFAKILSTLKFSK